MSLGLSVAGLVVLFGGLLGPRQPRSSEFRPGELANIDPEVRKSALRVIRSGRRVTDGEASRIRPVAEQMGRASARTLPAALGWGLVALGVMSRDVGQSGDGWGASYCGVGSVVIVEVEPAGQGFAAFGF